MFISIKKFKYQYKGIIWTTNSKKIKNNMVRWDVGSIPHGGPIELFFFPASAPQLY